MEQKNQVLEEIWKIDLKILQRFIYTLTGKDQLAMEQIFRNAVKTVCLEGNFQVDREKLQLWVYEVIKKETRKYYGDHSRPWIEDVEPQETENQGFYKVSEVYQSCFRNKIRMCSMINQLAIEEQQNILLLYYYDLSLKEISGILHLRYPAVESIHNRGMRKLLELCKE